MTDSPHDYRLGTFAYGLTQAAVDDFRDIMRREYCEDLSPEASWARAIEVLALFHALIGPVPTAASAASSNIPAIDGTAESIN